MLGTLLDRTQQILNMQYVGFQVAFQNKMVEIDLCQVSRNKLCHAGHQKYISNIIKKKCNIFLNEIQLLWKTWLKMFLKFEEDIEEQKVCL